MNRPKNPYSLSFGIRPFELIERPVQAGEIIEAFCQEPSAQRTYMITGVRGIGKTVLMTELSARFQEMDDWTVIALSPETDMIHSLAAKLAGIRRFAEIFRSAKINLSLLGMGAEIPSEPPITDDEVAVTRMMKSIQTHGGRVLITVDEVTNNEYIRKFAAVYQIWLRDNLPMFLLMTGLYENIYELQNEKSLTFLYRAPKVKLRPLNFTAIAHAYQTTLGISRDQSFAMAKLTRGYAFAFQVLGYFTFREESHDYSRILDKYRLYLDEYVYEKLWSELSPLDKKVIINMAETDQESVTLIREQLGMSSNEFSKYRLRLIRKGIIDGSERGIITFTLPLFKEFILDQIEFM